MVLPAYTLLRCCRITQSSAHFVPLRLCYAYDQKYAYAERAKQKESSSPPSSRLTSTLVLPVDGVFDGAKSQTDVASKNLPTPSASFAANASAVSVTTPQKTLSTKRLVSICAALSKARLTGLVVSTAVAGCALASPTPFATGAFLDHPGASLLALAVGTGLTSGAANCINQIMEVPYDSLMKRTQKRPLVRKLISPLGAGVFAAISAVSGLTLLYTMTNPLVAELAFLNLVLYTCVYTPMKRLSQMNTWVGSLVGAIPPLMGWATATGSLEWGSLILASLLYVWQFPHFMALSVLAKEDYARAGYVMTANVNPPLARRTALRHSVASAFVCLAGAGCSAISLGPWAGWSLGLGSLPVNAALIYYAWGFYKAPLEGPKATKAARKLFRASLVHLPVVMTAMLICTHWSNSPWA